MLLVWHIACNLTTLIVIGATCFHYRLPVAMPLLMGGITAVSKCCRLKKYGKISIHSSLYTSRIQPSVAGLPSARIEYTYTRSTLTTFQIEHRRTVCYWFIPYVQPPGKSLRQIGLHWIINPKSEMAAVPTDLGSPNLTDYLPTPPSSTQYRTLNGGRRTWICFMHCLNIRKDKIQNAIFILSDYSLKWQTLTRTERTPTLSRDTWKHRLAATKPEVVISSSTIFTDSRFQRLSLYR